MNLGAEDFQGKDKNRIMDHCITMCIIVNPREVSLYYSYLYSIRYEYISAIGSAP